MAYDINAALQRLEQNLKDLSSARTQVENTIKASSDLQKVVSEYVTAVELLCKRLKQWDVDLGGREKSLSETIEECVSLLRLSSEQIVSFFFFFVEETTTVFNEKVDSEITRFAVQNNKLADSVLELNTLRDVIKKATDEIESIKETITQISKDLKESQEGQDAVLKEIYKKVETIGALTQRIDEKIDSLCHVLNILDEKADSTLSALGNISDACKIIVAVTSEIKSSLQSSTEQITKVVKELREESLKSININRWIIIGGMIVLAVLQLILR